MRRFFLFVCLLAIPVVLYAKEFKVVTFNTENAGKVFFDHDVHLKKLSNNCPVCHNALYQIAKKNPTTSMADMEKGKSCGFCHNKTRAFALAECTRCHVVKEVPIEIPDFGTLTFSHKFHVTLYSCGDCHNKLFKASPDNPHASMAQMEQGLSCGGCHDGTTAFTVKATCTKCHTVKDIDFGGQAFFSHTFHLEMYKCGDCHSRLFVAGPRAKRYSMQDMEQGSSCGGCHEGKTAFSVKGDCAKCHRNTKDIPFKPTNALFSHQFHLGIYRCADCHSGIFVGGAGAKRYTMPDMEKARSCGACHLGDIAFSVTGSCDRCHKNPKEVVYDIKDAGKAPFSHTVHTGMYKCDDCHNKVFTTGMARKDYTMADMEKGRSCGTCHDGKSAFSAAANCGRCHPVKDFNYADDALFSHNRHLEMYKCYDCHKGLFVAGPGNKHRSMAEMEKGVSCGACHFGDIAFSVAGSCDRCHKSTIEIAMKTRGAGVTWFSHKVHVGMYKCDDCHNSLFVGGPSARRYTMADMEKGSSCGACHDGKTAFTVKENCERCHPVKEIRFKDAALFSHKFHIALYRCNDCHDKLFIPGPENRRYTMPEMEKGKSCGGCHDSKTAFAVTGSCEKCHKPVAIKYEFPSKMSVKSVIFSHKLHLGKGYNCSDCHYKIYAAGAGRRSFTMQEMNEGKSCGACHGMAMAFSVRQSDKCVRCHLDESDGGQQTQSPQN